MNRWNNSNNTKEFSNPEWSFDRVFFDSDEEYESQKKANLFHAVACELYRCFSYELEGKINLPRLVLSYTGAKDDNMCRQVLRTLLKTKQPLSFSDLSKRSKETCVHELAEIFLSESKKTSLYHIMKQYGINQSNEKDDRWCAIQMTREYRRRRGKYPKHLVLYPIPTITRGKPLLGVGDEEPARDKSIDREKLPAI